MKKLTIISIIIIVLGGVGYYLYLTDSLNSDFLKKGNSTPIVEEVKINTEISKANKEMFLKISDVIFTFPSDWKVEQRSNWNDKAIVTMPNSNFPFELTVNICDSDIWRECFGSEAVWQDNFVYPTSTSNQPRFGFALKGGSGYYEAVADFGEHEVTNTEYKAIDAVIKTAKIDASKIEATLVDKILFEKYKTNIVPFSKKAPLDFSSNPDAKSFITRIKYSYQSDKANFGGHYITVVFGCGASGCIAGMMIDVLNGKIYDLPLGEDALCNEPDGWFPGEGPITYPDSNLFIARVCKKMVEGEIVAKTPAEYIAYVWNDVTKTFKVLEEKDFITKVPASTNNNLQ